MTLDHPIFTRWPAQYPDRLQGSSSGRDANAVVRLLLDPKRKLNPHARSRFFKRLDAPIGHEPSKRVCNVKHDRNPGAVEGERNGNDVQG